MGITSSFVELFNRCEIDFPPSPDQFQIDKYILPATIRQAIFIVSFNGLYFTKGRGLLHRQSNSGIRANGARLWAPLEQ